MNYYQEITLLSDADIALGFLWHKVSQQVHIALVEQKVDHHSAIAVSFPEYGSQNFPLGSKLRLLAKEKNQLDALNLNDFLARLQDYTHVKSIQPIPETKSRVAFVRKHVKGQARIDKEMLNKAHLWAKKSGKSPNGSARFPLFIERVELDEQKEGLFNCYGLSAKRGKFLSSVPNF